ncbi:hypothetical protein [Bacillus dakarensis]|uniref:hypothetical protein n=1 Tax=Robertmurraya dakarensis TaxID=1926278 RepID=UPI0009823221|nr:hypothetical protein [Bacillus dakarensis]
MEFYEKLPTDLLVAFYYEIMKNIEKGILTKNMYVEIGFIISVASQRGIELSKPSDFEQILFEKSFGDFVQVSQ